MFLFWFLLCIHQLVQQKKYCRLASIDLQITQLVKQRQQT